MLRTLTVAACIGLSLWAIAADAGHAKRGRGPGRSSGRRIEVEAVQIQPAPTQFQIQLTPQQQQQLIALLQGLTNQPPTWYSPQLQQAIALQSSLPPGIQRQVAQGRPLPPGLARRAVVLPAQSTQWLGLPDPQVQVLVIGNQVAVVDPLTQVVITLIGQILR